jgi:hypothetical protein
MNSLRDVLAEWTDVDVAQFKLAQLIGLINANDSFISTKWMWWSDNQIGNQTFKILESLVSLGFLQQRSEPDIQFRWDSNWNFNTAEQDAAANP